MDREATPDPIDAADYYREAVVDDAVAQAMRKAAEPIVSTGECLNCGTPVLPPKRWCDAECCADWDARNAR